MSGTQMKNAQYDQAVSTLQGALVQKPDSRSAADAYLMIATAYEKQRRVESAITAFTEAAEPEEVMDLLRAYHAALGKLVLEHQGTLERFAGDAVMVFFNDPLPVERPAEHAGPPADHVRGRRH